MAIVDTETWEVSRPPVETDAATSEAEQSGGMPWISLALVGLVAAPLVAAVRRWRPWRAVEPREQLVDTDGEAGPAEVEVEERMVGAEEGA